MIENDGVRKGLHKNPQSRTRFFIRFQKISKPYLGTRNIPPVCYSSKKGILLERDGVFDPSQAQVSYGMIGGVLEQMSVVRTIEIRMRTVG